MLGMFLLTGIMLFSTAIYFFERGMQLPAIGCISPFHKQCIAEEPNSKFYSIPSAWWWCKHIAPIPLDPNQPYTHKTGVATMTTVGYGDLVPVTTGGKIVAAMASVCGIIVLAFPISMIIDKFAESTGEWRGGGILAGMRSAKGGGDQQQQQQGGGDSSVAGGTDPSQGFRPKRLKSRRYFF